MSTRERHRPGLRPLIITSALLACTLTAHAEPELRIVWQPKEVAPGETVNITFALKTLAPSIRPKLWWGATERFRRHVQGSGPEFVELARRAETQFTMSFQAPAQEGEVQWYLEVQENGPDRAKWSTRPITLPVRTPEKPFGLRERVPVQGLKLPAKSPPPPIGFEPAFKKLQFDKPLWLGAPSDGTDRIFVAEMAGRIHVFPNKDDVSMGQRKTFLDLTDRVKYERRFEQGLLGVAFHPQFHSNGQVFVHYIKVSEVDGGGFGNQLGDDQRKSVVARFTVSPGDPNLADPNSEHVIIEWPQPGPSHNAGGLCFGPDGLLYIGVADGAWAMSTDAARETGKNAQDLRNILGSIIRLDVDSADPYAIPTDNPFRQDGTIIYKGVPTYGSANGKPCEEIFSYGHRNPWRLSFDRETGQLWEGEIGQVGFEEINIIKKGANYGWNAFEGPGEFNGNKQAFDGGPYGATHTKPFFSYSYGSLGKSVIAGHVYRGAKYKDQLGGLFLFGDFASHKVFAMDPATRTPSLVATVDSLSSFGEDEAGEVYAVSLDQGRLFRVKVTTEAPKDPMPEWLSDTGLFQIDEAQVLGGPLNASAGIIEFGVNAPLWSDDAKKRRWVALPGYEKIVWSAGGAWEYPTGTVLIKHFELGGRRLETRLLVNHENGWQGYTYIWNDAQSDAQLFVGDDEGKGLTVDYPRGTWTYPSQADCMACHNAASGFALGPRTGQLNGEFSFPGGTDNQLRAWDHIGLFKLELKQKEKRLWAPFEKIAQLLENLSLITRKSPPRKFASLPLSAELERLGMDWSQLPAWANPYTTQNSGADPKALYSSYLEEADAPAPAGSPFSESLLDARARAYLAVNCMHCHLPGGSGDSFDARFMLRTADTNLRGAHSKKGFSLSNLEANGLSVADSITSYYDANALSPGYDADGQLRIKEGDHSLSTLWLRTRLKDQGRMPPIGTSVLDQRGMALLGAWIDSMDEDDDTPLEANTDGREAEGLVHGVRRGQ